jgi:S-adenosylmethionine decarboxylase proenzyme
VAAGVGKQTICELWGAHNLNSVEVTERALRDAVNAAKATLVEVFVHRFAPHGISGIAVIAESHLAIHTWPELGYCAADFFTCSDTADHDAIVEVLRAAYDADHVEVKQFDRGVAPVTQPA